jgi:hypothetical protein
VILMSMLGLLGFILSMFLQSGSVPSFSPGILNSDEKSKIDKASRIERRIKIYETASNRIHRTIQESVSKEEFQAVPGNLKIWTSLLSESLKDIEINLDTKKKSRALINYEIQLRKAITTTKGLKIRAPVDQQDIFDSHIAQAETIRKRFVQLLFQLRS